MTDHAKEIEEIANKFHTYELDRGQYTLHPMTLDGQKLAAAAAEIRRLQAENARLQKRIDAHWPKTAGIPGCGGVGRIEDGGESSK